jgi:hypothetical protein
MKLPHRYVRTVLSSARHIIYCSQGSRLAGIVLVAMLGLSLQACKDLGSPVAPPNTEPPPVINGQISFAANVQPIFLANCALGGCHTAFSPAGNFNVTSYGTLRAGGFTYGTAVIVPGDSATSGIMAMVRGNNNLIGLRMPLGGQYTQSGLPDSLIVRIGTWIVQGALNN